MPLKLLYRPPDELMANSVKDLLEQEGIPTLVRSFQVPAYDGIAQVMRPAWGEVMVRESDWDRAKEVLDVFLQSRPETDEPGE